VSKSGLKISVTQHLNIEFRIPKRRNRRGSSLNDNKIRIIADFFSPFVSVSEGEMFSRGHFVMA